MRQIFVSVDINAPMYWWKEFDTYKIGTTANSTSTMHRIHCNPITPDDFETDGMGEFSLKQLHRTIEYLETIRNLYNMTNEKQSWSDLIKLLPASYKQLRTCTLNYEVLYNIYHARHDHKLIEWHIFCDWIKTLPYAEELI
jgi:hypothetical protein